MTTFLNALADPGQQAPPVAHRHYIENHLITQRLGLTDKVQFGFVREDGFADEINLGMEQCPPPSVGPLTRCLGTFLRVGDVLQMASLV